MTEEVAVSEPAPVEVPTVEIKLFKKWTTDDVNVTDISLTVSLRRRAMHCGLSYERRTLCTLNSEGIHAAHVC